MQVVLPPAIKDERHVVCLSIDVHVRACGEYLIKLNGNRVVRVVKMPKVINSIELLAGNRHLIVDLESKERLLLNADSLEPDDDKSCLPIQYVDNTSNSKTSNMGDFDLFSEPDLGVYTLVNRPNGEIVWSLRLPPGSAVSFLGDFKDCLKIEAERKHILATFTVCLVYATQSSLVFYGVQRVSIMEGLEYWRGEPIFSLSLLLLGDRVFLVAPFITEDQFLIRLLGERSSVLVEPFPRLRIVEKLSCDGEISESASLVDAELVMGLGKDLVLAIDSTDKQCHVCRLDCTPEHFSLSRNEVHESMALHDGVLFCNKPGDGKLTRKITGIPRMIDGKMHVFGPGFDDFITKDVYGNVTDVQFVNPSAYAVTCLSEDGLVYYLRSDQESCITGRLDLPLLSMLDPFSGVFRFSEETLELAPLVNDIHNLYEPCKVFSTSSFKIFHTPEGKAMVLVRRKESLDLLVKRFNGQKIAWERILKVKDDDCAKMLNANIQDFSMSISQVYVKAFYGVFSVSFELENGEYPSKPFALISLQLFDQLNDEYKTFYDKVKHQRQGMDCGFLFIYILELMKALSKDQLPIGLLQFGWLAAHFSECKELLINAVKDYVAQAKDWNLVKLTGFVYFAWTMEDLYSMLDDLCKTLAVANLYENIELISIFYVLMNKSKTMTALWKASKHPDAVKVASFLNTPDDERRKLIGEKSAFALMAKQRFYMSILFFLLIGKPRDAMQVSLERLKDDSLAFTIARLSNLEYSSDSNQTPIEDYFTFSNMLVDDKDSRCKLLLTRPKKGWWPPMVSVKTLLNRRNPHYDFIVDDIVELWRDGLFLESIPFIDSLGPETTQVEKLQLRYEAKSLS